MIGDEGFKSIASSRVPEDESMRRVKRLDEGLRLRVESEDDLFGPDNILLLQQYIPSADGSVVRTELIDGEFLFAMKAYF